MQTTVGEGTVIVLCVCVFVSKNLIFLADDTFQSSSSEYFFCHQRMVKVFSSLIETLLFFSEVAKAGSPSKKCNSCIVEALVLLKASIGKEKLLKQNKCVEFFRFSSFVRYDS